MGFIEKINQVRNSKFFIPKIIVAILLIILNILLFVSFYFFTHSKKFIPFTLVSQCKARYNEMGAHCERYINILPCIKSLKMISSLLGHLLPFASIGALIVECFSETVGGILHICVSNDSKKNNGLFRLDYFHSLIGYFY